MKNWILAILHQIKAEHAFINIFITHNSFGIFSKYSHENKDGKPKVGYNTLQTANKAAESMSKKRNVDFKVYRCGWCGKYHIGRNNQYHQITK